MKLDLVVLLCRVEAKGPKSYQSQASANLRSMTKSSEEEVRQRGAEEEEEVAVGDLVALDRQRRLPFSTAHSKPRREKKVESLGWRTVNRGGKRKRKASANPRSRMKSSREDVRERSAEEEESSREDVRERGAEEEEEVVVGALVVLDRQCGLLDRRRTVNRGRKRERKGERQLWRDRRCQGGRGGSHPSSGGTRSVKERTKIADRRRTINWRKEEEEKGSKLSEREDGEQWSLELT